MTIQTSDELKNIVIESIESSGKTAKEVMSGNLPHAYSEKTIRYENTCLCEVDLYSIIVQHFYGHKTDKDVVCFRSTHKYDREENELSVIKSMLYNVDIKAKCLHRQISFEVPPEENKLRTAICAYFNSEQKVWQARDEYHKKLAILRETQPDC